MQEQSRKRLQELASEERRLQRESQDCHAKISTLVTGSLNSQASSERTRGLAALQERLTAIETRWKEYQSEADNLRRSLIDENQIAEALADFESVWTSLNFNEQGRLLRTLLERIDYDGKESTLSLTFNAIGLQTFGNRCAEVAP